MESWRVMEREIINITKKYLENNYSQIFYVDEIANKIPYNYNILRYYFARKTGMTLGQYLNKIKCHKAAELLRKTDWKLFKIAGEVGFHDDKYFVKVFEKYFGISPNEYRHKENKSE